MYNFLPETAVERLEVSGLGPEQSFLAQVEVSGNKKSVKEGREREEEKKE